MVDKSSLWIIRANKKAQSRFWKIGIAPCNLIGEKGHLSGPVDHKRNETSWHLTKQNDKISLKFDDTAYKWYRSVHCVFARSTMGFKRPWVRFSPLGPFKSNDFTLEIVGFFSFMGQPHLVLTTILTTMPKILSGQSQGQVGFFDATSSAAICEPALMPTIWKAGSR